MSRFTTPVYAHLVLNGWAGLTTTRVITVGSTPTKFRIRALTRTKLGGRNRWLEPGQEALVPRSAVRHGAWSTPALLDDTLDPAVREAVASADPEELGEVAREAAKASMLSLLDDLEELSADKAQGTAATPEEWFDLGVVPAPSENRRQRRAREAQERRARRQA